MLQRYPTDLSDGDWTSGRIRAHAMHEMSTDASAGPDTPPWLSFTTFEHNPEES